MLIKAGKIVRLGGIYVSRPVRLYTRFLMSTATNF